MERSVYVSGVLDEDMKTNKEIKKTDLYNSRNKWLNTLQYKRKNIVSPQVLSDSKVFSTVDNFLFETSFNYGSLGLQHNLVGYLVFSSVLWLP
jgi:hypothetical protein